MAFRYDARPDEADFRDKLYLPSLINVPVEAPVGTFLRRKLPVLNQGSEGACTGFALATVVHYLNRTRAGALRDNELVSARMLYEMAKRNDRWSGEDYSGSSCRGAVKGWHKHGVCAEATWPYDDGVEDTTLTPLREADAAQRPLGAYYRVNTHSLTHMHTALAEVGVLLVSAKVHKGWQRVKADGLVEMDDSDIGGHAFALVGYDKTGFWFQNSWGANWGYQGCGHITYSDWLKNGMDAWVCRSGVPVQLSS
jgi:C1A family cysteine protease